MDEKNKVRLKYYECNMTKGQHMLAYLFFSVMIGVVLFIYYRFIPVAVIGGFIIGIWQEKNYSQTVTKRRQEKLRLQLFRSPSAEEADGRWKMQLRIH